jgi:hypothetical protein
MAGLYEGLEEVAFKRTEGGYVFQANNRFLLGPRRRFLVNEAQKTDIASCMRETFRRIRPFVFGMVVLPAAIGGLIYWFIASSATLTVIVADVGGKPEVHDQTIGRHGASGTIAGPDGSSVAFRVSGPPGPNATTTITAVAATGKVGDTSVVGFNAAGTTINMTDASKKRIVRVAKLVGRTGPTRTVAAVFAGTVTLVLFGLYIAAIHIYSMRRLNPLLVGLPRTNERIRMREGIDRFAAKVSIRLLALMGVGAAAMLTSSAINLVEFIVAHRPLDQLPFLLLPAVAALVVAAQTVYLVVLRRRQRSRPAA